MPGLNIPGVTDKYNTNETVEKLMQIERIPLTREEKTLEGYKEQQSAWRNVNRKMSSLRDSVKTLYSFDNPFNNKLTTSTEEHAISATATRNASYDSFKVDVIQPATADRFLTSELDSETKVPAGTYTYKVADKTISLRWKGGSLIDFSEALNRRGDNYLKTRVIGASKGKKTLSIESLKTGSENRLIFENDARTFAETSGMITKIKPKTTTIGTNRNDFRNAPEDTIQEQQRMPKLSSAKLSVAENNISVPPRTGFSIQIPESVRNEKGIHLQFSIKPVEVVDITIELNKQPEKPIFPDSGVATFKDVVIHNAPVDDTLPAEPIQKPEPLEKIFTDNVLYAKMIDGSEKLIQTPQLFSSEKTQIDISMDEFQGMQSLVLRNRNTGYILNLTEIEALNPSQNLGFIPQHPITIADDAIIKYEGITIKRPTNEIDDVVPEITLNIHDKTDKTATISIKPDIESAKDALITFVGNYNQAISELNILSQNKPEIIEELDYLSEEEKETERKKLGMFLSDSTLTSLKSNLQNTTSARYPFSDTAEVTMLSQIGIATNATNYSGYTPSKLRGYLEIDEKTLDTELEKHLDDVKNIFGFDSDGDLIIDSGIGYKLDKQLTAYVQSGGIFALKTSSLDSKIKSSEQKISRLESQLDDKEADLRNKYGRMEGTLNSLEGQQSTISNFSKQQNRN
ncbi:MAG: flagellar filament capping protein FliD [Treponema sp.]|nr:flagellar filament capping protein FliD [Treponema sp.]